MNLMVIYPYSEIQCRTIFTDLPFDDYIAFLLLLIKFNTIMNTQILRYDFFS